jgi:hypothetical protein
MAELQITPPHPGGRIPCPGAGTLVCDASGNVSVDTTGASVGATSDLLTLSASADPVDPPSAGKGFWFNATGNKLFIFNGTAWVQLSGA